jgi:anthranilate/para-aminobenzoate synthase component I
MERRGDRKIQKGNPLVVLQQSIDSHACVKIPGLPPFVGGAVGFLGFDAYHYIEPFVFQSLDDLQFPDLSFFFFDEAVVIDHLANRLWIVVLAPPRGDPKRAYDEVIGKIERLLRRATRFPEPLSPFNPPTSKRGIESTHSGSDFEAIVRQAKEFISRGEIYQVNLSQRISFPLMESPWSLYQRLSRINPSPFAAYADLRDLQIVSASPERFLRVQGGSIETRPIAGTRPRGDDPVETARLRQELILNEKERAEHLMLVDLERNDLGRISRYGSVRVDELMVLEEYSHVIHIVSNVRGTLRPKVQASDLFKATFPGGTISGCPKIRALQIIDQLEPIRRAGYTGSLGYVSATGEMDFNLLIRTAFVVDSSVYVQAGAGIVADSDPSREYEETLHKAQALMEALHAGSHQTEELVTA